MLLGCAAVGLRAAVELRGDVLGCARWRRALVVCVVAVLVGSSPPCRPREQRAAAAARTTRRRWTKTPTTTSNKAARLAVSPTRFALLARSFKTRGCGCLWLSVRAQCRRSSSSRRRTRRRASAKLWSVVAGIASSLSSLRGERLFVVARDYKKKETRR